MYSRALTHLLFLWFASTGLAQPQKKKILVLGGDGLLGSETVARLKLRGHDVTVLSRGTWYWDSAERIKPAVTFIQCDRNKLNACSQNLVDVTREKTFFDVVMDFSGYRPHHIKDLMRKMRSKIRRYIYISSDSVYEVCKEPSHDGPTLEEDAVRPEDPAQKGAYAERDPYGNSKLECEDAVRREKELWNIPYMILRLPDVIGPRDNTDRFWSYLLWLRFHDIIDRPLELPSKLQNKPLSFVFSEDVANLLIHLPDYDDGVFNFAYNIAFLDTVTLEEFLRLAASHMGISDVKFDKSKDDGLHYFPSVKRGAMDVSMALHHLHWNPHKLSDGIRKTVQFYEYAMRSSDFKSQRNAILNRFSVPRHAMEAFKKRLKDVYGVDYDRDIVKDEL